jgi:hypothetical protein
VLGSGSIIVVMGIANNHNAGFVTSINTRSAKHSLGAQGPDERGTDWGEAVEHALLCGLVGLVNAELLVVETEAGDELIVRVVWEVHVAVLWQRVQYLTPPLAGGRRRPRKHLVVHHRGVVRGGEGGGQRGRRGR